MTSHREAPKISKDPAADNTDLYAFVSPDRQDTVTILANYIPLEEPAGGPNFHTFDDSVLYEINIDNDGDGIEEIAYQFRFQTTIVDNNSFLYNKGPIHFDALKQQYANLNAVQTCSVTRSAGGKSTLLGSGLLTAPANIGPESTPTYESELVPPAIQTLSSGEVVFAGPRSEGFYVDLGSIFDLLLLRPFAGAYALPPPPPTPNPTAGGGVNDTSGYNVHTIALQVPITNLTSNGTMPSSPSDPAAVLGIYASASRQRASVLGTGTTNAGSIAGPFTQVSRLGMPLINEVLIPLRLKDFWNTTEPKDDAQFAQFYKDPEPARLIPSLYPGVTVPPVPRDDIVAILLTGFSLDSFNTKTATMADLLRLNVATKPSTTDTNPPDPARLGLLGGDPSGFPNGRRVFDDVVDIEIQALAGGTPFTPTFNKTPNNQLGDGVNSPDKPFLLHFPYLATPQSGYLHVHTHN
jgi:hypothetical protein